VRTKFEALNNPNQCVAHKWDDDDDDDAMQRAVFFARLLNV
jgi:hypothetical protein